MNTESYLIDIGEYTGFVTPSELGYVAYVISDSDVVSETFGTADEALDWCERIITVALEMDEIASLLLDILDQFGEPVSTPTDEK